MKRVAVICLILSMLMSTLMVQTISGAVGLEVTAVTTDPTTVSANSSFKLSFSVLNRSGSEMTDVYVTFGSGEYVPVGAGSTVYITGSILSGQAASILNKDFKRNGGSETKIPITLTYKIGGTTYEQSDVLPINASVTSSTPTTPVDTSAYEPSLSLQNSLFPILYQGGQNVITLTLINKAVYQAKNVTITPDYNSLQANGLRMASMSFLPADLTIDGNKTGTFSLVVLVDDTVAVGTYPLSMDVTYQNAYGNKFVKTIKTYVKVQEDPTKAHQVVIRDGDNQTTTVDKGDQVTLAYVFSNNEPAISAAEVKLGTLPSGITVAAGTKKSYTYNSMNRYTLEKPSFTLQVTESASSGWVDIPIVYTYVTNEGNRLLRQHISSLYIGKTISNTEIIGEVVSYPTSVNLDESFKVSFQVKNTGDQVLDQLKVIVKDNPSFLPKSPSLVSIKNLEPGRDQSLTFDLVASGEGLVSRNYPLTFELQYAKTIGDQVTQVTEEVTVGIYVFAQEEDLATKGVPKIIVNAYEAIPKMVDAGTEFDLTMSFLNTNKTKTIYNIKAFLTMTETSQTTQNNIFMPVNSSNTFYMDEISPKSVAEKTIRLYAMPDAQPKTYTIQVNFEYEDAEGNPYTATELIGVNVKQPTKVEMSDLSLPTEAFVGDYLPLYFDVFNTGKVKVYNLNVKIEGPFQTETPSKYIGNFEPGYQDYYDGAIIPSEIGTQTLGILLSYDDPTGERIEIRREFTINVMESYFDPNMGGEFPGEEFPGMEIPVETTRPKWLIPAIIGGSLVVVLIIVIVVLKKRKAKKEGLMVDED